MRIGSFDEEAGEMPDADATRAPAGGQVGRNGHRYEGGQFLPSTDAPPGTWDVEVKGKRRRVAGIKDLVEPGVLQMQPTPYSRAIHALVRYITDFAPDGKMRVNPRLPQVAIEHHGRGIRPGAHGVISQKAYTVEQLVRLYNRGQRWIDAAPSPKPAPKG